MTGIKRRRGIAVLIVGIQDEILKIHSMGLLEKLLADRTTGCNILWATDAYNDLGEDYKRDKEIRPRFITGKNANVIKNRSRKELERQIERTRRHAEVFTPFWVCEKMNDYADEEWFGRKDVFHKDKKPTDRVVFQNLGDWMKYVDSRRLEIACGEAPYLVSRYDVESGESIEIKYRSGMLDRKLRVVNENASDEDEWLKWAARAFESVYGYEFQGDNVLIARVNLLMTYVEYLEERLCRRPTMKEYEDIINIIVWNIWQMDGLTDTIPYCKAKGQRQETWDEFLGLCEDANEKAQPCVIYDWRAKKSIKFCDMKRQ